MRILKTITAALLLAVGISAAALAQGTVSQEFINAQTGTTYTITPRDCGQQIKLSNVSNVAVTLPQAGTTIFAGCFFDVVYTGSSGKATITPTTSTINGASSVAISTNEGIRISTDGTNYFLMNYKPGMANVAGTGSFVGSLTLGLLTPASFSQLSPITWIKFTLTDGNIYYMPAWR